MAPLPQPVLVYDRISQNRRKTLLLVAVAILSLIPFVGGISYSAAVWTVSRFGHHSISQSQEQRLFSQLRSHSTVGQSEEDREIEREVTANIQKMRQGREEDEQLLWRLMVVFGITSTAVLGLLFWSMASSPTSQVLAMCGARPAGSTENEAKRLLENLAIGAGLPPPRLYVIDSPVPNAFAAGIDPARSVVAVTQGLLTLLDHRELEGVLAHELSHIGNRDTRLNTVVTAIVLFMRLPYLMRQKSIRARRLARSQGRTVPKQGNPVRFLVFPVYIYVFFVAPFVAVVIRAAISRGREFLADADAALLTRYPEGLLRALAKIRGAGSVVSGPNALISHLYFSDPSEPNMFMGLFRGNLLATHPPIEQRINRLTEFNGGVPMSVLEAAARVGVEYAKAHPATTVQTPGTADTMGKDELSVLTAGTPMGRVHRVMTPTRLYDQPNLKSCAIANIAAGALVVVFDDPGKFRQVLTHNDIFGYMPLSVKLKRVDMLPAEIHDESARAALDAREASAQVVVAPPASGGGGGLTQKQIAITAVFGIALFAGIFLVLIKFGGS